MRVNEKQQLEQAYQETSFQVLEGSEPFEIRIGEPNPALERLLARAGAVEWAYLTAFNPRSRLLEIEENEERQLSLARRLAEDGYLTLPGYGVGKEGDWHPEPSILVLGITREMALKLGKLFEQNAILVGRKGGLPELLWC